MGRGKYTWGEVGRGWAKLPSPVVNKLFEEGRTKVSLPFSPFLWVCEREILSHLISLKFFVVVVVVGDMALLGHLKKRCRTL